MDLGAGAFARRGMGAGPEKFSPKGAVRAAGFLASAIIEGIGVKGGRSKGKGGAANGGGGGKDV